MIVLSRDFVLRTAWLLGGGILLAYLVIWFGRRDHEQPRTVETTTTTPAIETESALVMLASRAPSKQPTPELAGDGIPIMGPGSGDSTANGPRHPHPITPQHQRIFKENLLLGTLNGAMDVGDVDVLRQLNQQYRREFPDDPQQLQSGYDLIADCLEARTDDTRARAERYFDQQRGSTVRRYVKRHCLE